MTIHLNFGRLAADTRPAATTRPKGQGPFRIALLGDFSGRAHRGEMRSADELARCKPIRLDVDTIDRVIASFETRLRIGAADATIDLNPASLDELHPDSLYERLPMFAELVDLRQRLAHPKFFPAAAEEVRSWCAELPPPAPTASVPARGSTMRVDAKLSDFARLLNQPPATPSAPAAVDALLRRLVAPHVVEATAPDAAALTAAVDRALATAMRSVLHDPDFQRLEAAWRSLDFVVRRVETGASLQVVVYDISAEEFAADLSATDDLQDTGLYRLLVEQPALDAHQGPLCALIANYGFEFTPPHAELLGRTARIAARARAPFIAAIGRDCIGTRVEDMHPLMADAWAALRTLPAARFLMLTAPRFLLRAPYGDRSEPIDSFDFQEFDAHAGLKTLLWGNPAILAAVLLARQATTGAAAKAPSGVLSLGDMPYFFHTDTDGETVALPCAERLLSERMATQAQALGVVPVLAMKGRAELRLAGFMSVAGTPLAGPWSAMEELPEEPSAPAPEPVTAPAADAAATAVGSDITEASDAELDALLAQLKSAAEPEPVGADAIDPDLAALLSDL
jgi:type VI secretion system protein ImpC